MTNKLNQFKLLAETIPCALCKIKSGFHIEEDGGCRHRGITTIEMFYRLQRLAEEEEESLSTISFEIKYKRK